MVEDAATVTPTTPQHDDVDLTLDETLPKGKGARSLTWWRLGMIAFVFTCSGPGGLEQVVKAGGPLLAVLGIFAVPVLYVMPQIFVVSELGAMLPTGAGNVVWVHRAFGRTAGFYNAWIFALSNMVDIGAYPALFGDYVCSTFYPNATYAQQMMWRLFGLFLGAGLSLASAKDVSTMTSIGCIVLAGFSILMFGAGLPHIDPGNQWGGVASNINYSLLGSSLMWLYTGWTSLGSLAGETKNSRVLLHGMTAALGFDLMVYIMSLFAALTVSQAYEWDAGFFVTVIERLVPGSGPYFGVSVIINAMSLYLSAMTCYSRAVWGMAEMGWAPQVLKQQLSNGSPYAAVAAHFAVGFVLIWFDLGFIVQVEYTVAASSYILTYVAFLRLRYIEPDTHRPYVVPGGMPFAWLITMTKVVVMGSTMVAGLMDFPIMLATVFVNALVGIGYYVLLRTQPSEGLDEGGAASADAVTTASDAAQGPSDEVALVEHQKASLPLPGESCGAPTSDDVDAVRPQDTTTISVGTEDER